MFLGVNDLKEALALRNLGYKKRILVLGPALPSDFASATSLQAEITLGSPELLESWEKSKSPPPVHLKIDTGLSRQGFSLEQLTTITERIQPFKKYILGLMTHFANVEDVSQQDYALLQLKLFHKAQAILQKNDFSLLSHAAASASAILLEQSRLDLCRIGISFYGCWPTTLTRQSYSKNQKQAITLKAALSWKAKITSIRQVPGGTYISYGCTYKAPHALRIGVLPVGYYEGYPRIISNKQAYVLCRGKKCLILGIICMNMMIVDLTDVPQAQVGETAVLIGQQDKEQVTAEDIASWAETITRDIFTRIHPSITRCIV